MVVGAQRLEAGDNIRAYKHSLKVKQDMRRAYVAEAEILERRAASLRATADELEKSIHRTRKAIEKLKAKR